MSNFITEIKENIQNWWVYLLLGIMLIVFGVYFMTTPLESYLSLAILFVISFFASGIFKIIFAISNKNILEGWGWHLAMGIIGILLGIYLARNMGVSMAILPFLVSFFFMMSGASIIAISVGLNKMGVKNWYWTLILGILTVLLSFLLIFNPVAAGMSLVYYTGLSFIFAGAGYIFLSLRMKSLKDDVKKIKG